MRSGHNDFDAAVVFLLLSERTIPATRQVPSCQLISQPRVSPLIPVARCSRFLDAGTDWDRVRGRLGSFRDTGLTKPLHQLERTKGCRVAAKSGTPSNGN